MKSTRYENENLDLYVRRSRSVASKKAWKSFLIPLQYQHHFPYTYSYLRSWIIAFKTTRLAEMEEEQKMKNTREKLQVTKRLFCTWLCKLETLIRVEIFPLHSLIHTFNSRVLHFFSLLRWFQFFLVFLLLSLFTFLLPSTTQKKKIHDNEEKNWEHLVKVDLTQVLLWVLIIQSIKGYWASGDCYLVHEI
jgi:hypothetical protein